LQTKLNNPITMTLEQYKTAKKEYNRLLDELHAKLNSFPKLENGLVADEALKSEEYLTAIRQYMALFAQYRKFNQLKHSKLYAKMLWDKKVKNLKKTKNK